MSAQAIAASPAPLAPSASAERIGGKAVALLNVLLLGAAPAVALGVVAANGGLKNPWVLPLVLVTVLVNLVIVTMDLRYGLALFILAAALSPKIPGLYNNLRVEDFVFVLVFVLWLFKHLRAGRLPRLQAPMILPFLAVTLMSLFCTGWGAAIGQVKDPIYSVFLQLKRVEYFLIFCVVATSVRSEPWLRLLTLVFIASGAAAAGWGMLHAEVDPATEDELKRVTGPQGENYNTLSGYLVICIGVGVAAIPAFRRGFFRSLIIACTALAGLGLLLSFSREGYIMLVGSLLVFGFTKDRWMVVVAFVALIGVIFIAEPVRETVGDTVHKIQVAQHDDPGSNSLTARLHGWQYRWEGWVMKQPILGNGVGSVPLSVDNEYLLRICETGMVGFLVFAWWLATVWKMARKSSRARHFVRVLGIGLMAAFVGLLIQGLVGASFTTIRTMEPFFFLLGLVTAGWQLMAERAQKPAEETPPAEPSPRLDLQPA